MNKKLPKSNLGFKWNFFIQIPTSWLPTALCLNSEGFSSRSIWALLS